MRALKWSGLSNKFTLSNFLIKNGLCFLNGALVTNERTVVRGGDILSVRGDIFKYLEKKRLFALFKRCVSKFPLFNKNIKLKLLRRAIALMKKEKRGQLKGGMPKYFSRLLKSAILITKSGAGGVYVKAEKNQPFINLKKKKKFHNKLKNKYTLLLKHFLSRKKMYQLFSSNYDDLDILNGGDNFFQRLGSSVIMYNYPASVNRFFSGCDLTKKKRMNPRTLKNFYERNYKY